MADREHPARAAARRSMEYVHAKDRESWIANFAADAIVEDPIGASPLCPDGKGHRGHDAIAKFWDTMIGPNRVLFEIRHSYAAGAECANVGTISTVLPDGSVSQVDGVFTYRVDDAGKVLALRAYWEFEKMRFFPPVK